MMSFTSRPLSNAEIEKLERQGCTCDSWRDIVVDAGFDPRRIKNVHFSGEIYLGVCVDKVIFPDGRIRPTGIYNAEIHNCRIQDNVYINRIHGALSNYTIEEGAVIENVDSITVEGESTFGNGVRLAVMNEAGGRDMPLFDALSPQTAYIWATQRHRCDVINMLEQWIEKETASKRSTEGRIGKSARIEHCGALRNVIIGEAAELSGVTQLNNGSIISSEESPVRVGSNVIATDFIFSGGSYIHSSAFINKCFIGMGSNVGVNFTAKNSLIFGANLAQGEASSLFAGPNTTSSHKSTLLIAGMLSFFNAGSGANQSNHMYKLGAVHQGVLERGCKTGSNAYLLWPSKVAPFSIILGKHLKNIDTSEAPFSLIIENNGKSLLLPGWNLQNIGLWRDDIKWRERMQLSNAAFRGRTIIDMLTPFTVRRMQRALLWLKKASTSSPKYIDLKRSAVARGIDLYESSILFYLQRVLVRRFSHSRPSTRAEFHKILAKTKEAAGDWVDAGGLLMPHNQFSALLNGIESGDIKDLEEVENFFTNSFDDYPAYEWSFAAQIIEDKLEKKIDDILPRDIVEILLESLQRSSQLLTKILTDAGKEFNDASKISYGLEADKIQQQQDFENVRGVVERNEYVQTIKANFTRMRNESNTLIQMLEQLAA